MSVPLSCSSRAVMRSAMTTALVPGRLANASDTAGSVAVPVAVFTTLAARISRLSVDNSTCATSRT